MSVDNDDEDHRPGEIYHVEKILSDGGIYSGQWCDHLPQGQGKYVWFDGCVYMGEWEKGKPNGEGKFLWPSGATYEGEFKNGHMDGGGTYTGSCGDTYKGSWVLNKKHGKGTDNYPNGDCYDGEWWKGFQDGHGRYQWRKGNYYIGQWKNGKFNGNGSFMWTDGKRYDGCWEDGLPKGNGTFRWADGSFYVGVWSKNSKEQSGTYYPAGSGSTSSGHKDWDPQEVFSAVLNDCVVCPCEDVPIFPSDKRLHLPEMMAMLHSVSKKANDGGGRTRWMSADARLSSYGSDEFRRNSDVDRRSRDGFESSRNFQFEDSVSRGNNKPPHLRLRPPRKPGETISKGHKNYDLMRNLQIGIRHAVARPAPNPPLDLKPSAFDPNEKVWTKFPPEGSKHTPPHSSCEFRWKDYCPVVFRALRKLFKVDPADYMISICGDDALRELSSPGKSGSFFYLTSDDRYMIKTMKKSEGKVLLRMLPAYYNHVRAFENTLVTKFYGLHCVKLTGSQKKVRFVIMGNLFCSEFSIHRRFDLKGSTFGRTTDKPESEIDATTTLKDLDLNYLFRLQKDWFEEFCVQVDRDCELLEQERIMDYSMLVGLHFQERQSIRDSLTPTRISGGFTPKDGHFDNGGTPRLSIADRDKLLISSSRLPSIQLGINMPARAERTVRKNEGETPQLVGEPTGEIYEIIIFFGIIDILQDYDISKKLEHAYKAMQYDATTISAVDPGLYSRRFRDFIFKVFVEDT